MHAYNILFNLCTQKLQKSKGMPTTLYATVRQSKLAFMEIHAVAVRLISVNNWNSLLENSPRIAATWSAYIILEI